MWSGLIFFLLMAFFIVGICCIVAAFFGELGDAGLPAFIFGVALLLPGIALSVWVYKADTRSDYKVTDTYTIKRIKNIQYAVDDMGQIKLNLNQHFKSIIPDESFRVNRIIQQKKYGIIWSNPTEKWEIVRK